MQRQRSGSHRASATDAVLERRGRASFAALAAFALCMLSAENALAQSLAQAGDELNPSAQQIPLGDNPPAQTGPAPTPPKKKRAKKHLQGGNADSSPDPGGAFVAAPPGADESPLPEVPMMNLSTRIGIKLVRGALLDEPTSADLESGMRGIAFQAPLSQNPIVLRVALDAPCAADDDPCFIQHAAPEGVDSLVVGVAEKSSGGITLRLRQLLVLGGKRISEVKGEAPAERLALKAEAEALICKLLVPVGCNGELQIDAGDATILEGEHPLPGDLSIPMHVTAPVGLLQLSAKVGKRTGPARQVPVLREKAAGISLAVRSGADGAPVLMTPAELAEREPRAAPGAAVAEVQSQPSGAGSHWNRPVGLGVAGAGVVVVAAGLIEGLHAKSQLNDAQAAYNANGGAWQSSDLGNLNSGNSAAKTANLLLIIGGVAAAAGLAFALAF